MGQIMNNKFGGEIGSTRREKEKGSITKRSNSDNKEHERTETES